MDIIEDKALLVRTKNPQRIIDSIQKSKLVGNESADVFKVLVNWELAEASLLAKLVKDVPSPINRDYNWPGLYKPFAHQKKTSEFLSLHQRAFCFNEQGTGKTASAIWSADYLIKQGQVAGACYLPSVHHAVSVAGRLVPVCSTPHLWYRAW